MVEFDERILCEIAQGIRPVYEEQGDQEKIRFGIVGAVKYIDECIGEQNPQRIKYVANAIRSSLCFKSPEKLSEIQQGLERAVQTGNATSINDFYAFTRAQEIENREEWINKILTTENTTTLTFNGQQAHLLNYTRPINEYAIAEQTVATAIEEGDTKEERYNTIIDLINDNEQTIFNCWNDYDSYILNRFIQSFTSYTELLFLQEEEGEKFDIEQIKAVLGTNSYRVEQWVGGGEHFLRQQIGLNPALGRALDEEQNKITLQAEQGFNKRKMGKGEVELYHKGDPLILSCEYREH